MEKYEESNNWPHVFGLESPVVAQTAIQKSRLGVENVDTAGLMIRFKLDFCLYSFYLQMFVYFDSDLVVEIFQLRDLIIEHSAS